MGHIDNESGFVYWDGPPRREDLGVRAVLLTDAKARIIFRALNVTALLVEMGADWIDIRDADMVRDLAREVLPEGIGVQLEAGE